MKIKAYIEEIDYKYGLLLTFPEESDLKQSFSPRWWENNHNQAVEINDNEKM